MTTLAKLTTKAKVWLRPDAMHFDDLRNPERAHDIITASCLTDMDMSDYNMVNIGTAHVVVELSSYEQMVLAKLESLQLRKTKILGEAQAEATKIDSEIQNLLALTHEVTQ